MLHDCSACGGRVPKGLLEVSGLKLKVRSASVVFSSSTGTGLMSRCQQDCFLPEAPGENQFFCLCQFLEATCSSWLMGPFLHLQNLPHSIVEVPSWLCFLCPSSLTEALLLPSLGDPWDYFGPTQIILDCLPIPKCLINDIWWIPFLPCKITYSHVCGLGLRHPSGGHYSVSHH